MGIQFVNHRLSMKVAIIVFALTVAAALAFPQVPQYPKHGQNGYDAKHYFQYANVNAPNVFEWGYRRGNDPNHFREEYLSQNNHNFKAKVRWGDAFEGKGEHFYDFNHDGYAAPSKPV